MSGLSDVGAVIVLGLLGLLVVSVYHRRGGDEEN